MTRSEFDHHFSAQSRPLRSFAFHLTQNQLEAEDLFQDTAYKALRYREQYRPQTNLTAWLMTIMRNTLINDWRRHKRRQQLEGNLPRAFFWVTSRPAQNHGEGELMLKEITSTTKRLNDGLRTPFLTA